MGFLGLGWYVRQRTRHCSEWWRRTQRHAVRRALHGLSVPEVVGAVRDLIGTPRPVLMMHSSLSHCGYIPGGPATVLDAVGPWADTLALPTHTYCYPGGDGTPAPVYDPRQTDSKVGSITNYFRRLPGVVRSIHPTHSLAARGPRANELCAGHEQTQAPCGRGTPYEKLVRWDAGVLVFGATLDAYTLFHTAEDAAGCPYLYEKQQYPLKALDHEGRLHDVVMWKQDMRVTRQFREMDTILQGEGLLRRRRLGTGELLFVPHAGTVHSYLLERLQNEPYYLVSQAYRKERVI